MRISQASKNQGVVSGRASKNIPVPLNFYYLFQQVSFKTEESAKRQRLFKSRRVTSQSNFLPIQATKRFFHAPL